MKGRQYVGLLMVGVALVLSTWAMYGLIRTGSCGSGGAVVYSRACPAGTGLKILGLMGSIFLALGGVGVASMASLGVLWFGLFFTLSGTDALIVAYGPASPPGSSGVGLFLGILFTGLMGVPVVIGALIMADKEKPGGDAGPAPPPGINVS